jgi:hypothetical protein
MTEEERERRRQIIEEARSNASSERYPISPLARMEMRERQRAAEREPLVYKTREVATQTEPEPEPISWQEWVEERLTRERELIMEAVGEALGEFFERNLKDINSELQADIRRLYATISEMQFNLRSLNKLERAKTANASPLPSLN